uniref:Uncharacterized protein n=1 Tax=Rhizophora mucronata TaxID=61149 RepID=A0A2P2Q763_RHIMU
MPKTIFSFFFYFIWTNPGNIKKQRANKFVLTNIRSQDISFYPPYFLRN